MATHQFKTKQGQEFTFDVPEPGCIPSFFAFSLPKSGSTLMMQMMADACRIKNIPVVDLPTAVFNLGIQPAMLQDDINVIWNKQGYAFLGFRSLFPAMDFDFRQTKNILLVRDPRDMLVSLFYSIKYSHVEPTDAGADNPIRLNRERFKNADIDQRVMKMAQAYKKYFQDYINRLPAETTRVYRYEDVIFKKREWLRDILSFLNVDLSDSRIEKIADRHDVRPVKEDPHNHIRQVFPGNYKAHLKPDTIDKLDELFEPVMTYFQYDTVVKMSMNPEFNRKSVRQQGMGDRNIDNLIFNLKAQLSAIRQSRSWRLTRPFRALTTFFRKGCGL